MNSGEGNSCEGISDDACGHVSGNFWRLLVAQLFTKLGDALASSKVVLPWLMSTIGVPAFLIGVVVPIRESGSLIPQLLIGSIVRQYKHRKQFFVAGCIAQALIVGAMGWAALVFQGLQAGVLILTCLILFSFARGFCSVSSKDVLGKCIPKKRRGRVGGLSASIAGFITLAVGVALLFEFLGKSLSLAYLLFIASICWVVAAGVYSCVVEFSSEVDQSESRLATAFKGLYLFKTDLVFRRFVFVRCLLLSSALATPYFVILAQKLSETDIIKELGFFIAATGLSGLVSGKLWGDAADVSSRKVIIGCSVLTCLICLTGAGVAFFFNTGTHSLWFVGLFFLLALVHHGVRLGRKTYVVDIAEGNQRTDYVTVSNTVIGIMLLVVGFVGAIAAQFSLHFVLAFFALTSAAAALLALALPEA